jgi:hypothetical protein
MQRTGKFAISTNNIAIELVRVRKIRFRPTTSAFSFLSNRNYIGCHRLVKKTVHRLQIVLHLATAAPPQQSPSSPPAVVLPQDPHPRPPVSASVRSSLPGPGLAEPPSTLARCPAALWFHREAAASSSPARCKQPHGQESHQAWWPGRLRCWRGVW